MQIEIRSIPAACPLCGDDGPHPALLRPGHLSPFNPRRSPACRILVVRCAVCGLLRLDPRPDDESLARLQNDALGDASVQIGSLETGNANPDYPPMLAERLRGAGFPAPGGRLLDIGCGGGELLTAVATELEAAATGLDASASALARARRRQPSATWLQGGIEPDRLEAETYDGATMIHVLEHLPDPLWALRTVRSWLRPEGLLAVEVPNGEFYFSRFYSVFLESPKPLIAALLRTAGRRVPFTSRGFYPYHLSLFGVETLRATVERAGFRILDLAPSTSRLEWWLRENRRPGAWPRYGINRLKLALARRDLADNLILLARRASG